MIFFFFFVRSGVFFVSASVWDSRNWNSRSNCFARVPSSGGGSNTPRPGVSVAHLPGRDRVRGLSETSGKCANFEFWAVQARAIVGSWLERKNHTGKNYFQVGIISKLASYFVPTPLFSCSHFKAFGLLSYDCCVVAFPYWSSWLKIFVRASVVFEGGRSLLNDIITPSVRADSSS